MNNIIPGYKGIMDLDLTNVDPQLHKIMIDQHYKDIDTYKIEQSKLKPSQRYENTIERIHKMHKYENDMLILRKENKKKEQDMKDKRMMEIYNKYKE